MFKQGPKKICGFFQFSPKAKKPPNMLEVLAKLLNKFPKKIMNYFLFEIDNGIARFGTKFTNAATMAYKNLYIAKLT